MGQDIRVVNYLHKDHYSTSEFWSQLIWALIERGFGYTHPEWRGLYIDPETGDWVREEEPNGDSRTRLTNAVKKTSEVGISGGISLYYDFDGAIHGGSIGLYSIKESDWMYVTYSTPASAIYREPSVYHGTLNIGRILYEILEPRVGYIRQTMEIHPPWPNELDCRIETLHNISYLPKEVVEDLGREKIKSSQIHKYYKLPNGGLELHLCEKALHGCGSEKREAVERHLGID